MEVGGSSLVGRLVGIATSPAGHALGLASVAAYLTYVYVGDLTLWSLKDIGFVVAVAGVVFFHRYRIKGYIEHDPKRRILDQVTPAFPLDEIEYVQGEPISLGQSHIIAIMFFATWCKGSRAALIEFQRVFDTYGRDVKFIALTQEPKEELEAYEVHGQKASNYKPLREFRFAIGIEGGRLTKEYQLKHNVKTVPHVYLVGRDDTIFWHGHPVGLFEDATRRTLAFDFSKPTRSKRDKIE
ncbi:unnamed protein product [Aphanomyces euteiches]|uniref:Thioredoxin domain-containing protein n=1 Tax=Aphanomyces euteiches TaxID=100861 RepID=A0A6G0WJR3_9STRA|nr:hypothetical protein Ae201684_014506 [Aphanomyces euteiches]KAH9142763.1 hypothetical protein AeRB84_013186 [Aphanomyces euteiches]